MDLEGLPWSSNRDKVAVVLFVERFEEVQLVIVI